MSWNHQAVSVFNKKSTLKEEERDRKWKSGRRAEWCRESGGDRDRQRAGRKLQKLIEERERQKAKEREKLMHEP